jgi:hypothetical protein
MQREKEIESAASFLNDNLNTPDGKRESRHEYDKPNQLSEKRDWPNSKAVNV